LQNDIEKRWKKVEKTLWKNALSLTGHEVAKL